MMPLSILQMWQDFTYVCCTTATLVFLQSKEKPTRGETWACGQGNRTKPASPPHIHSQAKRSLLGSLREHPYPKRRQGLVPCQRQAHFHHQSQEAIWQRAATLLFLHRAFVHKHSACKAEKHGNGIMKGCRAVGQCFHQHMELQLLTRKDLPPR